MQYLETVWGTTSTTVQRADLRVSPFLLETHEKQT